MDNKKFGRWVIIKRAPSSKGGKRRYLCQCECGTQKIVHYQNLKSGASQSCGCFLAEIRSEISKTHGFRRTRFYATWHNILQRCRNKKNTHYIHYGGRGIKCLWTSFEDFHDDMYESYLEHVKEYGQKQTTIERIDNDGDYCKENCKWVTRAEQAMNKRESHIVEYKGERKHLLEWSKITGIGYWTLYNRVVRFSWTPERALTTPVKSNHYKRKTPPA